MYLVNEEYMELGPTPCDEKCAQVGDINFRENANKEMKAYIRQLERMFPDYVKHGIYFDKKWFSHDFGSYGEVCIYWNNDNEEARNYAYYCEQNTPSNWDEEARKELGIEND